MYMCLFQIPSANDILFKQRPLPCLPIGNRDWSTLSNRYFERKHKKMFILEYNLVYPWSVAKNDASRIRSNTKCSMAWVLHTLTNSCFIRAVGLLDNVVRVEENNFSYKTKQFHELVVMKIISTYFWEDSQWKIFLF